MATANSTMAVAVLTGAGGLGLAIARRIAPGRLLVLADYSTEVLSNAQEQLQVEGYNVQTHQTDVADKASVTKLAEVAATAGKVEVVVHAAGVSPVMAQARRVLEVDLLGTAYMIDAFQEVLAPGGAMVCIASMAGHMLSMMLSPPLSAEAETHLAISPSDKLLDHVAVRSIEQEQPGQCYSLAKRANQLRVQVASLAYGRKGCRINSVSPGVIHTAMVRQEMAKGTFGDAMKQLVDVSPAGRFGTAADVAGVVAFLLGPESSFVTRNDYAVDGGSLACQRWARAMTQ